MDKQQSAVEEFFKDLPSEDKKGQDIFNDGTGANSDKAPEKVEEKEEEVPESLKNRQHRRLEQKLQRERESNIALAERLKVLSEQDRAIKETAGEIDPRLIRVFGGSDEGKEIAKHFTEILSETKAQAREDALREIEAQNEREQTEQRQYEDLIDNQLEALEDKYNVDLTSDAPQARKIRREYLELVEKLSPKDDDGTITDFADFEAAFEQYQEKNIPKIDNTRQKEIASRGMQRSGTAGGAQPQITPGFRGWEKDYNL